MAPKALQQGLGLVIRVLDAAAHWAWLIVLQLRAQLFHAGAAGQALALQQGLGHAQGLLGHHQLGLGLDPDLVQLLALGRRGLLLVLQGLGALLQLLLLGPEPGQVLERALLPAVVLEQGAQQLDLLRHGLGFGAGFAVQQLQLRPLLAQLAGGGFGALLKARQFRLALVQAITDLHQLLQAPAMGIPGLAQRREGGAVLQLPGDPFQALGHQALLLLQVLDVLLALGVGLLGALPGLGGLGQLLLQALQVALFGKGFAQQRRLGAGLLLGLGQAGATVLDLLLSLFLLLLQLRLLRLLLLDLPLQRYEGRGQFDLAQELMALRRQLLQALQAQAFGGQDLRLCLGFLQLLGGAVPGLLPLAQFLEPAVLGLQLLELQLPGLELVTGGAQLLVQFGTFLGWQRGDAAGLGSEGLVRFVGFLGLAEGALAQLAVDRRVGELFQQLAALLVVGLEEGAELALGQHHRAGELFEVEPQARFDQLLVFGFALVAQQLPVVQVGEALAAALQLAVGLVPGAVGFPASAVATAVDADEIHLGVAAAGAPAQQRARIAGGNVAVDIRDLVFLGDVVQPRHGAEQRQAQGVEQGALAGAGGAGDGEQAGAGQGFGAEVDLERAGQGGQVLQADGQDLHGCSPSCWTSCNSRAKSLRVCSSASLA